MDFDTGLDKSGYDMIAFRRDTLQEAGNTQEVYFDRRKRIAEGLPYLLTGYSRHSPRSFYLFPPRRIGNDNDSSNNPRVGYGNNP